MEKLIELFKEYVKNYGNDTKDTTIDYAVIYDGQGFYVGARFYSDEKVLSKKFGFIKWLVENEKIDLRKIKKLYRKSNENSIHTYPILYDYSYDESLLMYLSIQDEPIEFLCSLLK